MVTGPIHSPGRGGGWGTDDDAIHDNVASEISAIAEKAVPVAADMLIIEDSDDGNAKKMVQLSNLPPGYSDAEAIAAVEGEATLDLTGMAPVGLPTHGAAQQTDRTRNLWLPAAAFGTIGVGPTLGGIHVARGHAWLLDAAANEYVSTYFAVPEDWVSGTVAMKIYYTMAGANTSKAVMLSILMGSFGDGENMAAEEREDWVSVPCPDAANTLDITTWGFGLTVAAGEIMQIRVARIGADAGDTAIGDLQFLGLELEYTADM